MGLPVLLEKLFENGGYGPHLNPSIVPFAAALSSDGAEAATTEWVRDLLAVPIYLAPSGSGGSDSNDGLSAQSPVATLAKAVEIAVPLSKSSIRFVLAPGSYYGDVEFDGIACVLHFSGNVSISGRFSIVNSGSVLLDSDDNDNTLVTFNFSTANQGLLCSIGSVFVANCKVSVNAENSTSAVRSAISSSLLFRKTLYISVRDVDTTIAADGTSGIYSLGLVTITGTSAYHGLYVNGSSRVYLINGLQITSHLLIDRCVYVSSASSLQIDGSAILYGPTGTDYTRSCIIAADVSYILLNGSVELHAYDNSYCIIATSKSYISLSNGTHEFIGTNMRNFMNIVGASSVVLSGVNTFNGSTASAPVGDVGFVVFMNRMSSFYLAGTASGTVANAGKYGIAWMSLGLNATSLPGDAATSTADSTSVVS